MARQLRPRPARLVAASQRPVRIAGDPVSVGTRAARSRTTLLEEAVARPVAGRSRRVVLNVEDIRALGNPGVAYGVYLNLPRRWTERDRDHHHVGNLTVFGIEGMNSLDPAHDHVPGFRHTFDVTRRLRVLRRSGRIPRGAELRVTFLPELPVPPPGFRGDAARILDDVLAGARSSPVTVGRVSVFVG